MRKETTLLSLTLMMVNLDWGLLVLQEEMIKLLHLKNWKLMKNLVLNLMTIPFQFTISQIHLSTVCSLMMSWYLWIYFIMLLPLIITLSTTTLRRRFLDIQLINLFAITKISHGSVFIAQNRMKCILFIDKVNHSEFQLRKSLVV